MDNSWDRVAILDRRGIIRYSSPSSTRIYGYSSAQLLGHCAFDFIHPADLRNTRLLFRRLLSAPGHTAQFQYRARRKDGDYIWIETTAGNLINDPDVRGVVINERDVTARKRADAALLATLECGEALLRATSEPELLESICAAIVKMGGYRMAWVAFPDPNATKTLLPVARAGAGVDYVDKARIGWARGDPRGRGPGGRAMRTHKPVVCHDFASDPRLALWRKDALSRGYASAIALPLLWRSECLGVLGIYSDQRIAFQPEEARLLQNLSGDIAYGLIALRTRAERERLQRELLLVSEREQRRIAQDLHDGLCQQLLGSSFLAGALHRRLAKHDHPEAPALQSIADSLRTSAQDARALSHGLHPVDSAPGGLVKALEDFAGLTSRIFGIACRFHCPRPVLLRRQSTATHLYRIVQEAVGNAIKHGAATSVTIRLSHAGRGRIALAIRDNGSGIPPGPPPAKGMGLQIMRHRACDCGGLLEIRKSAPAGVLVLCTVPVSGRKPAAE
jgi:PAS domain S-box-containing protein